MNISNTTITTRLENALHGLQDEFKGIIDTNDFIVAMNMVIKAEGKSDYKSKLSVLYDMFDICGIKYEKDRELDYYKKLVIESDFPSYAKIEAHMLDALFRRFEKYPSPSDYMKRIVDRMCDEDDNWQDDTLRLRILKQFVKYGNSLKDAGYEGGAYVKRYAREHGCARDLLTNVDYMLLFVDDRIFGVLETATRDQRRPRGTYGLLKMVDDLAQGKFRTEGATKVALYLFAMAFGMTYYYEAAKNKVFDPVSDIDINLFRDYYTNNFIRFITEPYRGRLNEYEIDPSGQGINYKNYAEMVYLYYINTDLTPAEKIKKSSEMIKRIKDKMKGKEPSADADKRPSGSRDFKKLIVHNQNVIHCEDILGLDEESFEKFLCTYYNCDASKVGNNPIKLEASQNSAFAVYKELLGDITKRGISLDKCNYGLWFTDVSAFVSRNLNRVRRYTDFILEKYDNFMDLLISVNSYIGVTQAQAVFHGDPRDARDWNNLAVARPKVLSIDSASAVTRGAIVVAFYYLYNAKHEGDDLFKTQSFEDYFNDFKAEIDKYLERAHYNLFSGRDLFDVLTAFSSYAFTYL